MRNRKRIGLLILANWLGNKNLVTPVIMIEPDQPVRVCTCGYTGRDLEGHLFRVAGDPHWHHYEDTFREVPGAPR